MMIGRTVNQTAAAVVAAAVVRDTLHRALTVSMTLIYTASHDSQRHPTQLLHHRSVGQSLLYRIVPLSMTLSDAEHQFQGHGIV